MNVEPTPDRLPATAHGGRLKRLRSRNAMALVATMMVLMLLLACSLIGFAGMAQKSNGGSLGASASNSLFLTQKRNNGQQAEILADAGLRAAVQWINDQPGPPINISAFTPREVTPNGFYPDSSPNDSGKWTEVSFLNLNGQVGKFKVRFYPHADNATAAQRGFLVESVGTFNGEARVVRADIRQKNFAQYAYFTDNLGDPAHMMAGLTTFNGPVHVNNSDHKVLPIVWNSGSLATNVARLFQWDGDNSFTMWEGNKVGAGHENDNKVYWKKDTPADTAPAPPVGDEWKRVIAPATDKDGNVTPRTGPKMLTEKVEMPESSNELRDAALGGNAETVPKGVYVPTAGSMVASSGVPAGGIYINGQVDDMVLEATGPGNRNQVIYVYQDNASGISKTKWKVTIEAGTSGKTTLERFTRPNSATPFTLDAGSYPKTYTGGKPNGVIYSRDDIGQWGAQKGGLSGTVANSTGTDALNKLTIATRVENGNQKTINIDGNILYANSKKQATQAPPDSGVLGMVAGYIRIVRKARVEEPGVTGFSNYSASSDIDLVTDPVTGLPIPGQLHKVSYANNQDLASLSVHGTMMAFNTAAVDDWATRQPTGEFHLLGGYIAKDPSRFGYVDPNTQSVLQGYKRILNYDKRVSNQPPPYFPGTGQAYEALSYQRVPNTLQP